MEKTSLEQFILNLFTLEGFEGVLKIGLLILMVLYTIFSFVFLRQIKQRNQNFNTPIAPIFYVIALVHFILSVLLIFRILI